jgi:activating signal cointegrator complex subunit 3
VNVGTELYDPERGGFVDLSILDVLQIFGRAGRPQYDNTGHAILITPHKSLSTYLGLLSLQVNIYIHTYICIYIVGHSEHKKNKT